MKMLENLSNFGKKLKSMSEIEKIKEIYLKNSKFFAENPEENTAFLHFIVIIVLNSVWFQML
jgi:hypothetical protein